MREEEIEAVVGLLKINSLHRKSYFNMKTKKTLLQETVLKEIYEITAFPSSITREELSLLLGMSPKVTQIWFQNKRAKLRKKYKKISKVTRLEENEMNVGRDKVEINDIPIMKLFTIISESELKLRNKKIPI